MWTGTTISYTAHTCGRSCIGQFSTKGRGMSISGAMFTPSIASGCWPPTVGTRMIVSRFSGNSWRVQNDDFCNCSRLGKRRGGEDDVCCSDADETSNSSSVRGSVWCWKSGLAVYESRSMHSSQAEMRLCHPLFAQLLLHWSQRAYES